MSGGKFSKPRPHRDEERQLEQAFRQITGQEPKKADPIVDHPLTEPVEIPKQAPEAEAPIAVQEAQMDEAFRKVTGQQVPPRKPVQKPEPAFDLLPDNMDVFFDEPQPEQPEDTQPDFVDKVLSFVSQLTAPGSQKQTAVLLGICGICLIVIVSCIFKAIKSAKDRVTLEALYLSSV